MVERKNSNLAIIICIILVIGAIIFALLYRNSEINNTRNNYFHNYKVNEVQEYYLSLEEVAKKYTAELINDLIYYPKDVYEKLDEDYKIRFKDYNDFKSYIETLKNEKFLSAEILEYSLNNSNNKRQIYVKLKTDNMIIFTEESIGDYKIEIR